MPTHLFGPFGNAKMCTQIIDRVCAYPPFWAFNLPLGAPEGHLFGRQIMGKKAFGRFSAPENLIQLRPYGPIMGAKGATEGVPQRVGRPCASQPPTEPFQSHLGVISGRTKTTQAPTSGDRVYFFQQGDSLSPVSSLSGTM